MEIQFTDLPKLVQAAWKNFVEKQKPQRIITDIIYVDKVKNYDLTHWGREIFRFIIVANTPTYEPTKVDIYGCDAQNKWWPHPNCAAMVVDMIQRIRRVN